MTTLPGGFSFFTKKIWQDLKKFRIIQSTCETRENKIKSPYFCAFAGFFEGLFWGGFSLFMKEKLIKAKSLE
ncbi:hypothetical protein EBR21_08755 [bacterium]|nr:hypothetical protein [bacterium]